MEIERSNASAGADARADGPLISGSAEESRPTLPPNGERRWIRLGAGMAAGIFFILFGYTLYLGKDFFLPLTLAWILSLLLKPLIRKLHRWHIPEPVSAALVLITVLGVFGSGIFFLSDPATQWLSSESVDKVENKVKQLRRPAEKISKAAEKVEAIATMDQSESTPKVMVKDGGVVRSLMERTKGFVFVAGTTFILLYFLLASGDRLMRRLIEVIPRWKDKQQVLDVIWETERQISAYLWTVTLINVWEGAVVGVGLWLVGMPNPVLWGVMAALVNYIPYLGAICGMTVVGLVAFVSFENVGRALLAPAIYLAVNILDNFVGPIVMGKRLVINPVLVFISLMFWGWLWGVWGVLLAVPLLMTLKVLCDHMEPLKLAGEFLGDTHQRRSGRRH